MKFGEFMGELRARGVETSGKKIREYIQKRYAGRSWTSVLERESDFGSVLISAFFWANTDEGDSYWQRIYDGKKVTLIAKPGEIVHWGIVQDAGSTNWQVGCQTITQAKRMKLFKLLAKDLGYELC